MHVNIGAGELDYDLTGEWEGEVDLTAGLPPATRRSKRRMIVISPREEKSGPFTRTCTSISSFAGSRPVSWTMKGKNGARRRSRTGLVRFTRPARRSLRLTGIWSPRRVTLPGLALI